MSDRNRHRRALLREGLRSYLDAVTAIDGFTRMIQHDFRSILEKQLMPLQKATGLKLSPKGMTAYSEPYKSRTKLWAAQYAWIGVELPVVNSAIFYSLDLGLAWNYDDGKTSTDFYSSFYTKKLAFLDELDSKLRRRSDAEFEIDRDVSGIILWEETSAGTRGHYELDLLENVVIQWISVWKQAGGVSKVFSKGRGRK